MLQESIDMMNRQAHMYKQTCKHLVCRMRLKSVQPLSFVALWSILIKKAVKNQAR